MWNWLGTVTDVYFLLVNVRGRGFGLVKYVRRIRSVSMHAYEELSSVLFRCFVAFVYLAFTRSFPPMMNSS